MCTFESQGGVQGLSRFSLATTERRAVVVAFITAILLCLAAPGNASPGEAILREANSPIYTTPARLHMRLAS
jgi:hypothetical protein